MSTEKSWIGPGWGCLFDTEALFLPAQGWDALVTSLIKWIPVPLHFLQGHPMSQWANWAENIGVASYKSYSSAIFTQALVIPKAFLWGTSTDSLKQALFENSYKIRIVAGQHQQTGSREVRVLQRALGRVQKFIKDSWWTLMFKHFLKGERK